MSIEQKEMTDTLPIPMVLFCPKCGLQHIDAPDERTPDWDNPPHKSHLCHGCGCRWRPADVPTEGVAAIQTRGSKDTVFYNSAARARDPEAADQRPISDATQRMEKTLGAEFVLTEDDAAIIAARDVEAIEHPPEAADLIETLELAERDLAIIERLVNAAWGLGMGQDWNNGTHAKKLGYRKQLLDALPAAAEALTRLQGRAALTQAHDAKDRG